MNMTNSALECQMAAPVVLVLEDDLVHGALIQMVLEAAHIQVHFASSASEAIENAKKRVPDLILVGWDGDGIDGRSMLTFLRMRAPQLAQVPVILMTDREISGKLRLGLATEGYTWILQKPIVMSSLPKLVQRTVTEARAKPMRASRPNQLAFGRYISFGVTGTSYNMPAVR